MSILDDRASRITLAVSLLVHAALVAPVYQRWVGDAGAAAPAEKPDEPLTFTFVDPQPAESKAPDEPSNLVSTTDARAAQKAAPADLPTGAAYQAGRTPVPTTPREAGRPATGSPAAARTEADADRRTPGDEAAERPAEEGPVAGVDRRLAVPRKPLGLRGPSAPAGSEALPSPEVDQRLTRAVEGASFSLNTTAWDYAPYLARLKAAIEKHIAPPAAFYYGTAAWATRVRFRISPDGRLTMLRLLDHAGVDNLQYVAMDAVQDAADFEPLPPGFPEPYLEITANFYFNVLPER